MKTAFKIDPAIFVTAVVSSGSTHDQHSTHNTILHRKQFDWDNEEKYSANTCRDHLLPGIILPNERESEKEPSHTGITWKIITICLVFSITFLDELGYCLNQLY